MLYPRSRFAALALSLLPLLGPARLPAEQAVPAPEAQPPSFSFIVWGHPRGSQEGAFPVYFEETLTAIAAAQADFLVITGDMINGMWGQAADPDVISKEWADFDSRLERLGIPVYRLPGNHDVHSAVTRDLYLGRYPAVPYAFSFGTSRFLMLDTIGIARQEDNPRDTWKGGIPPFDREQMAFIERELRSQARYEHVFLFMHHPQPWADPGGFWWGQVHPLLKQGKTRAVFAGSPWYFKYAHFEEDGIHYILSSTLEVPDPAFLREFSGPEDRALHKQLDNIQHVRVNGPQYTIRTIPIGALSSGALQWKFWERVEKLPPRWSRNLAVRFHLRFRRFRDLALLAAGGGLACFLLGIFTAVAWRRLRRAGRNRTAPHSRARRSSGPP